MSDYDAQVNWIRWIVGLTLLEMVLFLIPGKVAIQVVVTVISIGLTGIVIGECLYVCLQSIRDVMTLATHTLLSAMSVGIIGLPYFLLEPRGYLQILIFEALIVTVCFWIVGLRTVYFGIRQMIHDRRA